MQIDALAMILGLVCFEYMTFNVVNSPLGFCCTLCHVFSLCLLDCAVYGTYVNLVI